MESSTEQTHLNACLIARLHDFVGISEDKVLGLIQDMNQRDALPCVIQRNALLSFEDGTEEWRHLEIDEHFRTEELLEKGNNDYHENVRRNDEGEEGERVLFRKPSSVEQVRDIARHVDSHFPNLALGKNLAFARIASPKRFQKAKSKTWLSAFTSGPGTEALNPGASNIIQHIPVRLLTSNCSLLASRCGHTGPAYATKFAACGKLLITSADDGLINIWSTTSGFFLLQTLYGHGSEPIADLVVIDSISIMGSGDVSGRIILWRLCLYCKFEPLAIFDHRKSSLRPCTAFAQRNDVELYRLAHSKNLNRPWMFSGGADGCIVVYNYLKPELGSRRLSNLGCHRCRTHDMSDPFGAVTPALECSPTGLEVLDLDLNPEATLLAVGGKFGKVLIFELVACSCHASERDCFPIPVLNAVLPGFAGQPHLSFKETGVAEREAILLNSTINGQDACVYHLARHDQWTVQHFKCPEIASEIRWSSWVGNYIVVVRMRHIEVWNPATGFLKHKMEGAVSDWNRSFGFQNRQNNTYVLTSHPQIHRIVMTCTVGGECCLWDIETGRALKSFAIGSDDQILQGLFNPADINGISAVLSDVSGKIYLIGCDYSSWFNCLPTIQFLEYPSIAAKTMDDLRTVHTARQLQSRKYCDAAKTPLSDSFQTRLNSRADIANRLLSHCICFGTKPIDDEVSQREAIHPADSSGVAWNRRVSSLKRAKVRVLGQKLTPRRSLPTDSQVCMEIAECLTRADERAAPSPVSTGEAGPSCMASTSSRDVSCMAVPLDSRSLISPADFVPSLSVTGEAPPLRSSLWLRSSHSSLLEYVPQIGDRVIYFPWLHAEVLQQEFHQGIKTWSDFSRKQKSLISAFIAKGSSQQQDLFWPREACISRLDYMHPKNIEHITAMDPSWGRSRFISARITAKCRLSSSSNIFREQVIEWYPSELGQDYLVPADKVTSSYISSRTWKVGDRVHVPFIDSDSRRKFDYSGVISVIKPGLVPGTLHYLTNNISVRWDDKSTQKKKRKRSSEIQESRWFSAWELKNVSCQGIETPELNEEWELQAVCRFFKAQLLAKRTADPRLRTVFKELLLPMCDAERLSFDARFLHVVKYPIDIEKVFSRLENGYYRHLEGVRHDLSYAFQNAKSYLRMSKDTEKEMEYAENVVEDLLKQTVASLPGTPQASLSL